MLKIDVILSKEALGRYLNEPEEYDESYDEWFEFKRLLRQHNIVVSDSLVSAYQHYFADCGYGDLFETYYLSQTCYANSQIVDLTDSIDSAPAGSNLLQTLLTCSDLDNPMYLFEKDHPSKESIDPSLGPKTASVDDVLADHTVSNKIRRMSLPFITQAQENEPGAVYSTWLKEVFHGEKSIAIYDPYALTSDSLNSIKSYFYFDRGAKLIIYTDRFKSANGNERLEEQLAEIAHSKQITIEVNDISPQKMHGRYIFLGTSNTFIDLGCGVDFLRKGKVRVDCSITFDRMNESKRKFRSGYHPTHYKTFSAQAN